MTILDVGAPVRQRPSTVPVAVYGHRWCGLTQMIARALGRAGVDFQYVDLDLHPEIEHRAGQGSRAAQQRGKGSSSHTTHQVECSNLRS